MQLSFPSHSRCRPAAPPRWATPITTRIRMLTYQGFMPGLGPTEGLLGACCGPVSIRILSSCREQGQPFACLPPSSFSEVLDWGEGRTTGDRERDRGSAATAGYLASLLILTCLPFPDHTLSSHFSTHAPLPFCPTTPQGEEEGPPPLRGALSSSPPRSPSFLPRKKRPRRHPPPPCPSWASPPWPATLQPAGRRLPAGRPALVGHCCSWGWVS